MKQVCVVVVMGLFILFSTGLKAQVSDSVLPSKVLVPYPLWVTYQKTTNLIFPYSIRSVDRGSSAVIVQKAKNVGNILQAKAARRGFEQTDLSVVTADGKFYSFLLNYADSPALLNIEFGDPLHKDSIVTLSGGLNEAVLEGEAQKVSSAGQFLHVSRREQLLRVKLTGIYLGTKTLWLKLHLHNGSQIDYLQGYTRFFLRDKKKSKRTAVRETELLPVYRRDSQAIPGDSSCDMEIGFKPFTVPRSQRLFIQMSEASGGRFIEIRISPRTVLNARKLL